MNTLTIPHPVWIEIDLRQFQKNVAIIRRQIGSRLFCLPVKANAYGHGLCAIGKAAQEAGIDYLAVAHLQEGICLRQANIDLPILVLGAIHEDQVLDLIEFHLEFTISSRYKAELVAEKCRSAGKKCRVHVEVDTGMHRTGVRSLSAQALFEYLQQPCFEVVGIYSHLATAEEANHFFSLQQIEEFSSLLSQAPFKKPSLVRHLANSGGTVYFPQAYFDMVRPSLLSFGYFPLEKGSAFEGIAPYFSLKAKISYFKVVEKGSGISYGHSYTASRQTRIVTVPIGYGDGYRRCLSNRGSVLIRGRRFPIVGAICMDQFMVDIGEEEAYVGEEVVLIGKQGNEEISVMEIARLCDTIPYEVLCFFNERVPRIYHTGG